MIKLLSRFRGDATLFGRIYELFGQAVSRLRQKSSISQLQAGIDNGRRGYGLWEK